MDDRLLIQVPAVPIEGTKVRISSSPATWDYDLPPLPKRDHALPPMRFRPVTPRGNWLPCALAPECPISLPIAEMEHVDGVFYCHQCAPTARRVLEIHETRPASSALKVINYLVLAVSVAALWIGLVGR